MHRRAAVLLLGLGACGPFFRGGEDAPVRERLTLCVQNHTIAYGNLVARAGPVRFDVMPGQEVCKPLIGTGAAINLRAVTTGGGIGGPRRYEERLPLGGYICWLWRLTDSPASSADLGPCRADEAEVEPDTAAADSSTGSPWFDQGKHSRGGRGGKEEADEACIRLLSSLLRVLRVIIAVPEVHTLA
ncbi:MAG TPA: hypothetical protein VF006_08220 [Longimicrobium sp.]